MTWSVVCSRWEDYLPSLADDSVDLIFTSPPYERARLYLENGQNLLVARDTDAWVAWMVKFVQEASRVCTGLIAIVCEGQSKHRRYSCAPFLLMADLHRAGHHCRKPPIFHRVGIPGSGGSKRDHEDQDGGADWLRNDYEPIICIARPGKLPWADGTAMGHPPKWAPGGEMSYRNSAGARKNQWGGNEAGGTNRKQDGTKQKAGRPSHNYRTQYRENDTAKGVTRPDGSFEIQSYVPPVLANPGNVISLNVGGGHLGSKLAHENVAPFPEKLVEFFVRSFCKPGGTVLDPFLGSGTTAAVAITLGRKALGCDLRQSQIDLSTRRLQGVTPLLEGMV